MTNTAERVARHDHSGDRTSDRAGRKRQAIVAAATTVFLRNGYLGASMDQVAALAGVSKQTVYKHFADKETLFGEILGSTMDPVGELDQVAAIALQGSGNLSTDLAELARWLLRFLQQPRVRQIRRLVIGEAGRFPELGRRWYEDGFRRGIGALADCFAVLAERGQLRTDDPWQAAEHFAGMVLWEPVNRIMFCGDEEDLTDAEIDRRSTAAVHAFLAAYGATPASPPRRGDQ